MQNDSTGEILKVFDDEGIEILKSCPRTLRNERISYIFSWSNYAQNLMENKKFIKVFLSDDISYYYACLSSLTYKNYDLILNTALEFSVDMDEIVQLFTYFSDDYQVDFIKNKKVFSDEMVHKIVGNSHSAAVIQSVIENYPVNLLNENINLERFFEKAKNSFADAQVKRNLWEEEKEYIHIPSTMITNDVMKEIWENYDIFRARAILDNAQYCTDTYDLEQFIKKKEDKLINDNGLSLINKGSLICDMLEEMQKARENGSDNLSNLIFKLRDTVRKIFDDDMFIQIQVVYREKGMDGLREYVDKCINNLISNYIIDYHFEVNFYNVMVDLNELMSYYFDGNISLDEEHVYLYDKIATIDYLSIFEKIELHNQLKQYNIKEIFYDDMAFARELVGTAIKDYSLTHEELQKYKDEKLSVEYGVPVYLMDGKPFFAIAKSGVKPVEYLPAGHSYSLIGDKGFAVFGDPSHSDTFLYEADDINPRQIVHVFPYDSFTYYQPFKSNSRASDRANMLLTPHQLIEKSGNNPSRSYNEILFLEAGNKLLEYADELPKLKKMALYCVDQIKEQDVRIAEANGVGIFLIDTSKYELEPAKSCSSFEHERFGYDYGYYTGGKKEKFEKMR